MLHSQAEHQLISIDHACTTDTRDLPSPSAHPEWSSEQLLNGTDEALIIHRGDTYRLRRTLTGKLILTK